MISSGLGSLGKGAWGSVFAADDSGAGDLFRPDLESEMTGRRPKAAGENSKIKYAIFHGKKPLRGSR